MNKNESEQQCIKDSCWWPGVAEDLFWMYSITHIKEDGSIARFFLLFSQFFFLVRGKLDKLAGQKPTKPSCGKSFLVGH